MNGFSLVFLHEGKCLRTQKQLFITNTICNSSPRNYYNKIEKFILLEWADIMIRANIYVS